MTKPRARISSPAEIALRRETARLSSQGEIHLVVSPAHEIIAVSRLDVFSLLRGRRDKNKNPLLDHAAYEAVRRLERDLDIIHGGDRSDVSERVDCATSGGQDDRRRAATARVKQVLAIVRPASKRLLEALLFPQFAGILTRWRDTVERETGQTREEVQTDRVRQVSEDLADAYVSLDYRTPKRA